ncbi:histidine kinase [Leptobacterium flavescens]|uniref:histidine kinase n=1 Tax=Leptobacterium flavescens TaxID=472055 RepID=A0A6P0UME1_9FLAO|nr:ATP-binding protein [Leptobacterium flavescens]NER13038.1 histidine kinase [Leptobacterium flavescens]
MASRHFYFQLIFRVIGISLTTFFIAYTLLDSLFYHAGVLIFFLVLQVVWLIKFLNHTNRKIAHFFEFIRNEDYSLRFSEDVDLPSLQHLHKNLNKANTLIRDMQIQSKTQEKYYQEILKRADIGILTINKKGHVLYANPTSRTLLNSRQLNHIRQLEKVDTRLFQLFSDLKPFERKVFQLTNERETISLALKSTEIVSGTEALTLITVQDINSELDEKETDSWIKLIRVLTHEIMNTVAPITSISESILNYYKSDDSLLKPEQIDENHIRNTVKGLEVIKEQGGDLMSFVQSYRSFLNVPVPDKKIIKLQELTEKVKVLLSREIEVHSVSFDLVANEDDLEVFADEKQITQVLINLAKNAVQSFDGQEDRKVQLIYGIDQDKKKYIEVRDNGPGIPEDIIDQIFVPFFTTKDTGTGIGLSLSKQIMQLHGGTLKVRSALNEGTSFLMVF